MTNGQKIPYPVVVFLITSEKKGWTVCCHSYARRGRGVRIRNSGPLICVVCCAFPALLGQSNETVIIKSSSSHTIRGIYISLPSAPVVVIYCSYGNALAAH